MSTRGWLRWPHWPWPSPDEWLFSIKCFSAAMLAFGVANWVGLPRPFWAVMTSYIVASPLAAAVRSKAVFRLVGTVIGSIAAVIIVPTFVNSPELLTLALSAWVGLCLFGSLLDRTPRGYLFMLAGYTAALIGFPSVDTPLHIFDSAVARVEEIGLGIVSASLVHSLAFPASLRPAVMGLLGKAVSDTRRWIADLVEIGPTPVLQQAVTGADRRTVAGDIAQLRVLSTHIPYDTSHLRWTAGAVHHVQDLVTALTPDVSAVEDRLEALHQHEGGLADDVRRMLRAAGDWLHAEGESTQLAKHHDLRAAVQALHVATPADPWGQALRVSLATRMGALIDNWQSCLAARHAIEQGLSGRPPAYEAPPAPRAWFFKSHVDLGMALLSAMAAMAAIVLCCAFWVLSGWGSGSAAAMMAAIFCCLFSSMDDPAPAIRSFLTWTLLSMPISVVYVLFLLPLVTDMPSLVLVSAPFLVTAGAFVARPSTFGRALPLVLGVTGIWSLHDSGTLDLVSLANAMLGQVMGVLAAVWCTSMMRSVGADRMARRIQAATWQELDALSRSPLRRARQLGEVFTHRMLDRIALLTPRVAQAGGTVDGVPTDEALRDLRLGTDIVALQRHRDEQDPHLQGLLDGVGTWFASRLEGVHRPPDGALLQRLDEALQAHLPLPAAPHSHEAARISALVGLRRNLFPGQAWERPSDTATGAAS